MNFEKMKYCFYCTNRYKMERQITDLNTTEPQLRSDTFCI